MARTITAKEVYDEYQKGLGFKNQVNLFETVKTNEDFFIGKQWEGVVSNGLPTPVFNFLQRTVMFALSNIVSDNLKLHASAFSATADREATERMAEIVNAEFDRIAEQVKLGTLLREMGRNAAVDGDGCIYAYWDDKVETGQRVRGAIACEVIENTRVFFGNPNDRKVQKQPYIIIAKRWLVDDAREKAKKYGARDWEKIGPDTDDSDHNNENLTDDKVTVLLRLWRDKKTETIWAVETTRDVVIREPWDTRLKLYPLVWMNWHYVQNNYHGRSMISGLIPNQVFVNKLFAMSMLSLMTTAYPKVVYDRTRIAKWDNSVGAAIPVNGGDVNNVAKILDPAPISPQIAQFIQMTVEMTQSNLGATPVALGEGKAYNTSAIIALQKAATTPSELTRQNLYQCVEDLGRIFIEFMRVYYGKRKVYASMPKDPQIQMAAQFAGVPVNMEAPQEFDFSQLENAHFTMKLDVGASSYWSEIAAIQTLDNLLQTGALPLSLYLRHMPRGYIPGQDDMIRELEGASQTAPSLSNVPNDIVAIPGETPGTLTEAYRQLRESVMQP